MFLESFPGLDGNVRWWYNDGIDIAQACRVARAIVLGSSIATAGTSRLVIHRGGGYSRYKESSMRKTDDQSYIVNLTYQLVGRNVIKGMLEEGLHWTDTYLYVFGPDVRAKLDKMTDAKLGEICGFGYSHEHSEPICESRGFIRMTGIQEVRGFHLANVRSGREILLETAVATIMSVLLDIMKQSQYEIRRDEALACRSRLLSLRS